MQPKNTCANLVKRLTGRGFVTLRPGAGDTRARAARVTVASSFECCAGKGEREKRIVAVDATNRDASPAHGAGCGRRGNGVSCQL